MRAAWLVVLTAGCGRFGFAERDANVRDGETDTVGDTQSSVCMNAAVCDDFERTDIGSGWTTEGAVAIDNTFAHSGSASVHMHIDAIAAGDAISARLNHPTVLSLSGPLWVRAWIKLGSLPAGGNHMELMCAEQSTSPFNGDCVFLYAANSALYTQFAPLTVQGTAPPVLPWFCFVWNLVRSPTTGSMHLTSDVIPPIDLTGQQTTSTNNPIDSLGIGANFTSGNTPDPQPALEVWFDDVIVSTSPVSCSD